MVFVLFEEAIWVVAVDVAFEDLFDCLNAAALVYLGQRERLQEVVAG